jgi:hypothetical protein
MMRNHIPTKSRMMGKNWPRPPPPPVPCASGRRIEISEIVIMLDG